MSGTNDEILTVNNVSEVRVFYHSQFIDQSILFKKHAVLIHAFLIVCINLSHTVFIGNENHHCLVKD